MNTVYVDTSSVSILRFELTQLEKQELYDQGYAAMGDALRIFIHGHKTEGDPNVKLPKGPLEKLFR